MITQQIHATQAVAHHFKGCKAKMQTRRNNHHTAARSPSMPFEHIRSYHRSYHLLSSLARADDDESGVFH